MPPFISAEDLAIFKVTFDRTKDWADIEAMAQSAPLDQPYMEQWLLHLGGERIWPRLRRLLELAERAKDGRADIDQPRLDP